MRAASSSTSRTSLPAPSFPSGRGGRRRLLRRGAGGRRRLRPEGDHPRLGGRGVGRDPAYLSARRSRRAARCSWSSVCSAPPNERPEAKFSDLNMLVAPGGRERTLDEYAALFEAAGFRLVGETGDVERPQRDRGGAGVNIGIALFEDAEELDWAGPWEVLAAWAQQWPDDGVGCSRSPRRASRSRCAKGLRVLADRHWESAPPLDVLVYPGGGGTRGSSADEAVLDWIRDLAGAGTLMTSVCTGSLVLAAAGLLDGRPATTHWGSLELLPTLGTRDRGAAGRPLRRRRRHRHRRRRLGRDRHGAAPRRAAALGRSGRARCAATSSTTRSRRSEPGAPRGAG